MLMASTYTGRGKPADGWTRHVPATLKRMKLSQALRNKGTAGKVEPTYQLDLYGEHGGAGFAFTPKKGDIEEAQHRSQGALRVEFEGQEVNQASMPNQRYLNDAEGSYDYSFRPRQSSMILRLEYSSSNWLLRVTFKNNDAVVVYGGVPINVFARLRYVEESGGSVGGAFWDLIRVYERRGLPVGGPYKKPKQSNFSRYGSKYKFLYTNPGRSLATGKSRPVALSRDEIERKRAVEISSKLVQNVKMDPVEFRRKVKQMVEYITNHPEDTETKERLRKVYESMKLPENREEYEIGREEMKGGGWEREYWKRPSKAMGGSAKGTVEGLMRARRKYEEEEE